MYSGVEGGCLANLMGVSTVALAGEHKRGRPSASGFICRGLNIFVGASRLTATNDRPVRFGCTTLKRVNNEKSSSSQRPSRHLGKHGA